MEIASLLALSVSKHASDLHLLPNSAPLMRIDGMLAPIKEHPLIPAEENKKLIYSIMTPEQQRIFETNRVFEMPLSLPNIGNFRVSILHQLHGIAAVFRVIPEKIPGFEELSLPAILKSTLTTYK